jgi:acetoin utilization deacetylase AcuC-like enzyme
VSAGFDAHREDPLGSCEVSEGGFAAMTASMRNACEELNVPMGCVLEGGYALTALGRSVAATMEELSDLADRQPADPQTAEVAEAAQARRRLQEWWPELGR